jgi:hypothetical protein
MRVLLSVPVSMLVLIGILALMLMLILRESMGLLASHTRFMYTRVIRTVLIDHINLLSENHGVGRVQYGTERETYKVPRL